MDQWQQQVITILMLQINLETMLVEDGDIVSILAIGVYHELHREYGALYYCTMVPFDSIPICNAFN